jgi:hypothetical protein
MLDLYEALDTDVAKTQSFWSIVTLKKDLVLEHVDIGRITPA